MKNKTKIFLGVILVVLLICGGYYFFFFQSPHDSSSFGKVFAEQYTGVSEDNVFVSKPVEDIMDIMRHGTGVVYLGYPECQ